MEPCNKPRSPVFVISDSKCDDDTQRHNCKIGCYEQGMGDSGPKGGLSSEGSNSRHSVVISRVSTAAKTINENHPETRVTLSRLPKTIAPDCSVTLLLNRRQYVPRISAGPQSANV